MPVPRRFDRQPPERDTTRINERIRVPEVRLIDENGQQVGIMRTHDALRHAQEQAISTSSRSPPTPSRPSCRVLDYSKYKYEQAQKQKAARKHQQQINVREIKFRPKIAQHDYDTKKGHVKRFLKARDKVKVTIMFRGREMAHPERGEMILNRLAEELAELAIVEQRPQQDGRNMTMMLAPQRARCWRTKSRPGAEHRLADATADQAAGRSWARQADAARRRRVRRRLSEARPSTPRGRPEPAELRRMPASRAEAEAAARRPDLDDAPASRPLGDGCRQGSAA